MVFKALCALPAKLAPGMVLQLNPGGLSYMVVTAGAAVRWFRHISDVSTPFMHLLPRLNPHLAPASFASQKLPYCAGEECRRRRPCSMSFGDAEAAAIAFGHELFVAEDQHGRRGSKRF
jgi:hypothetical protein